jgi:hypothetical protein
MNSRRIPPFDELLAGRSTLSRADCIDQGKVLFISRSPHGA